MKIHRREALVLISVGVLPASLSRAQHQMEAMRANPAAYKIQFFTPEEHRALDAISEMIIPADGHSPGASAAHVADFIDLIAANSRASVQRQWRERLHAFGLDPAGHSAALAKASAEESSPSNDAAKFFVDMKKITLHAYYTSEIGLRNELGYLGPEALSSFPGCRS